MDDKDNALDDEFWDRQPGIRENWKDLGKSFGILLLMLFILIGVVTLIILWIRWLF